MRANIVSRPGRPVFRSVLVTSLALLAWGCATPFRADVTRFQQLPAPAGQSFTIAASDPAHAGGIEFDQYAALIGRELAEEGYVPASSPGTADLVVTLDYGVDQGREKIVSDYDPFWGGYGGFGYGRGFYPGFYGRRYAYGFHDPFLWGGYGGWGGQRVSSYTVYQSALSLTIDRAADNRRLFEGKAEAMSRSRRLPEIVPNLVEAMFAGFPGNSGETVRISIAPEERRN